VCNKRPCRVCGRWFMADPRLKDRQMTCGSPQCKREWHRRKCAQWNKENIDYFRANYLQKKLDRAACDSRSAMPLLGRVVGALLRRQVQEVIGVQQLIIIDYLGRLLLRRFQEAIKVQRSGIARKLSQLPPS